MGRNRPWTDEELGFIQDHDHWSAKQIAAELGRPWQGVKAKRSQLRSGWTRKMEWWTEDEDQLLLELGPWASAEQLTDRFPGRTASAIKGRRVQLGLVTNFRQFDPHTVGARPLLAKTCTKCGRLLQADWFKYVPRGQYYQSHCRKCQAGQMSDWKTRVEYKSPDRAAEAAAAYRVRLQGLTSARATHHAQPYTEQDHAVLADPDLTALQKALKLGRTYLAVRQMCQMLGYKSHVGLGEPTDLWRIFNPNEPGVAA